MITTTKKRRSILKDESVATMIEYAFITLFIALALIVSLSGVANGLDNFFTNLQDDF